MRAGHHTAALVWHEDSDFTTAVTVGVRDEFEQLGIEVIAETSANFDAAKQKADVETVGAKNPSVLLTLPVDPVVTASAYKAVAKQGTKIVLLSSVPQGMEYGRDYVNVVTDDLFQMGKRAADALAAAVGDNGTVGVLLPRRRPLRHESARPGVPEDDHGQLPEHRGRRQAAESPIRTRRRTRRTRSCSRTPTSPAST